mmetsp:Transcript_88164/g.254429  ORF Transcript_88164/g.254429 Transcript_88164/m.254429 type:complete len:259 (+) Transcript_88164:1877-2653(+)
MRAGRRPLSPMPTPHAASANAAGPANMSNIVNSWLSWPPPAKSTIAMASALATAIPRRPATRESNGETAAYMAPTASTHSAATAAYCRLSVPVASNCATASTTPAAMAWAMALNASARAARVLPVPPAALERWRTTNLQKISASQTRPPSVAETSARVCLGRGAAQPANRNNRTTCGATQAQDTRAAAPPAQKTGGCRQQAPSMTSSPPSTANTFANVAAARGAMRCASAAKASAAGGRASGAGTDGRAVPSCSAFAK